MPISFASLINPPVFFHQVAERLNVDVRRGLSWREANDRMNFVGPNEFTVKEQEPLWKKYIEQFQNPLILLLLGKWSFLICFYDVVP